MYEITSLMEVRGKGADLSNFENEWTVGVEVTEPEL